MTPHSHQITLDFCFSRGTASSSPGTLYSMDVGIAEPPAAPVMLSLFPGYGIIPGKTTAPEVAKTNTRTKTINKAIHFCYECNGIDFWYNEKSKIVTLIYMTCTTPFPAAWVKLGFQWQHSYDHWLSLLKNMGYAISILEQPHVEDLQNHASFSAKARGRTMAPHPHEIELDFRYSRGTDSSSPCALYAMTITVAR